MARKQYVQIFIFAAGFLVLQPWAQAQDNVRNWMRQADDARKVGLAEFDAGNYEVAKAFLERSYAQHKDHRVEQALIKIYLSFGDRNLEVEPVEASYWYQRAVDLDEDNAEALFPLGLAHYRHGQYDAAVSALVEAERYGHDQLLKTTQNLLRDIFFLRGKQRYTYRDYVGSRDDYRQALKRSKNDPWVLLATGELDLTEKLPSDALPRLKIAAGNPRVHARANLLSGAAWQQLRKWDNSLPHFRKAVTEPSLRDRANEGISYSQFQQAGIELRTKQYASAVPRLEEVTSLRPSWTDGWFYLGQAYIGNRQGYKARDTLLNLKKLDPAYQGLPQSLATAYVLIGTTEGRNGQYSAARDAFLTAIEYDNTRGDAYYFLGNAYVRLSNWEAAVQAYAGAQQRNVFYDRAGLERGRVLYHNLQRYREALAILEDVEVKYPATRDAHVLLADLYQIVGTEEYEARAWSETVRLHELLFKYRPEAETRYGNQLGIGYVEVSAFDKAVPWLARGLQADPENKLVRAYKARAHVGLADAAYASNNWKEAIVQYEMGRTLGYPNRRIELPLANAYYKTNAYSHAADLLRPLHASPITEVLINDVDALLVSVLGDWSDTTLPVDPARAVSLADEAIGIAPEAVLPLYVAGAGRMIEQDWDGALKSLAALYAQQQDFRNTWLLYREANYLAALQNLGTISWPARMDPAWITSLRKAARPVAPAMKKAGLQLQTALGLDAGDGRVHFALGMIQIHEGALHEALGSFHSATGTTLAASARELAGNVSLVLEDPGEALMLWDMAASIPVNAVDVPFVVAGAQVHVPVPESWRNAPGHNDTDFRVAVLSHAETLEKQGAWVQRAGVLYKGVQQLPDDAELNWLYGDALYQMQRREEALPYLARARTIRPEVYKYQSSYATAQLERKQWMEVLDAMLVFEDEHDQAKDLSAQAYYGYAWEISNTNRQKALEHVKQAFERRPESIQIGFLAGFLSYNLGDWQEAADFFDLAYRYQPSYNNVPTWLVRSLTRYAETLADSGRLNEAEAELGKAASIDDSLEIAYTRSYLLHRKGQELDALQVMQAILFRTPGFRNTEALYNEILRAAGPSVFGDERFLYRTQDMIAWLEAADAPETLTLAMVPALLRETPPAAAAEVVQWLRLKGYIVDDKLDAWLDASWAPWLEHLIREKDWYNAAIWSERLIQARASSHQAHYLRGRVYEAQDNEEKAEFHYQRALDLHPGDLTYEEALDRVD